MSEQEAMAKIVLANGSVMYVSDDDARKFLKRQLGGTSAKKGSANGAPNNLTCTEKDGKLVYTHPERKTRAFEKSVIQTAKLEVEEGNFTSENKRLGVKFVSVNGKPICEKLVEVAIENGFIE